MKAGADAELTLPEGETVLMTAAADRQPRRGEGPAGSRRRRATRKNSVCGQTALMWAAGENHGRRPGADRARRGHRRHVDDLRPADALEPLNSYKGGFTRADVCRHGRVRSIRRGCCCGPAPTSTAPSPTGSPRCWLATINGHYDLAALLVEAGAERQPDRRRRRLSALPRRSTCTRSSSPPTGRRRRGRTRSIRSAW